MEGPSAKKTTGAHGTKEGHEEEVSESGVQKASLSVCTESRIGMGSLQPQGCRRHPV